MNDNTQHHRQADMDQVRVLNGQVLLGLEQSLNQQMDFRKIVFDLIDIKNLPD